MQLRNVQLTEYKSRTIAKVHEVSVHYDIYIYLMYLLLYNTNNDWIRPYSDGNDYSGRRCFSVFFFICRYALDDCFNEDEDNYEGIY